MAMTKQERAERKVEQAASLARMEAARAQVRAVVVSGVCPQCGCGLRRNLSLSGWWQCQQFGAEQFRKDKTKPACGWQGFTE